MAATIATRTISRIGQRDRASRRTPARYSSRVIRKVTQSGAAGSGSATASDPCFPVRREVRRYERAAPPGHGRDRAAGHEHEAHTEDDPGNAKEVRQPPPPPAPNRPCGAPHPPHPPPHAPPQPRPPPFPPHGEPPPHP